MNIDQIIHKYLLNNESEEERNILESWKTESKENISALNAIQKHWDQYKDLKEYRDYDKHSAWQNVSNEIEKTRPSLLNLWLRIAAVFLLFAGTVYFMKAGMNSDQTTAAKVFISESNVSTQQLQDQSRIWLNKNTKIDYSNFDLTNRELSLLEGEAYFDISSNKDHPFRITVNGKMIKVLGTEFNIKQSTGKFRLDVVEGSVSVSDGQRTIIIKAGETLISDDTSMSKANSNSLNINSWKTKELVFRNSNLLELAKDLSEYYDIQFLLDPKVKMSSCLINTKFTDESIKEVINELKTVYGFDIDFDQEENSYRVLDTKC